MEEKCSTCKNNYILSDGRMLCKKRKILKSLVHEDYWCEKYTNNWQKKAGEIDAEEL